jgi:hypothetical protein
MRSRWVWLIVGVVALAVIALFVRPRPQRLMVIVISDTNNPTVYAVQVNNLARRPYVFSAWSEYETAGAWKPVATHKHNKTLKPSEQDAFTLPKPELGKGRVCVVYGAVSSGNWEDSLRSLRALSWFYPKAEKMYVDAP